MVVCLCKCVRVPENQVIFCTHKALCIITPPMNHFKGR